MSKIFHWRVKCLVHGYQFVWQLDAPTVCPLGDEIDTDASVIINTINSNAVHIVEEEVPTGGHLAIESRIMNTPASSNETHNFTFGININVLRVVFIATAENTGDEIELSVNPNMPLGVSQRLTATTWQCNTSLLKIGYYISTSNAELGKIREIAGDVITVENSSTENNVVLFSSVKIIREFQIGPPGEYSFGETKIGSSFVPANVVVRITYKNNTAAAKQFYTFLEYLY